MTIKQKYSLKKRQLNRNTEYSLKPYISKKKRWDDDDNNEFKLVRKSVD